jgi:hypothetical protein
MFAGVSSVLLRHGSDWFSALLISIIAAFALFDFRIVRSATKFG